MPKKKLNNRLEKLFEDIEQEPEVKQAKAPKGSGKKASKKAAPNISIPPVSETPETFSDLGFSKLADDAPARDSMRITPSTMLSTAFRTDENNWATLKVVDELEQRHWGMEEQMLVKQVADQLSLALENARLFQETQLRTEELSVLNDLARKLSSQLNVEQVLQETYKGIAQLINARNFFIGLYNPERHEIEYPLNITESAVDKEITVVSADQGISGYIFRTKKPLLIKSNLGEWLKAQNMEAVGDIAASWLGVPLMIGDDFLGVMAVQDYKQPEAYDEHALDIITAFASQAAIAIENARSYERIQQAADEMSMLFDASQSFSSELLEVDEIAKIIARIFVEAMDFPTCVVSLYDPKENTVRSIVELTSDEAEKEAVKEDESGMVYSLDDLPALMRVIEKMQPQSVHVSDPEADPTELAYLKANKLATVVTLPLTTKGSTIGIVELESRKKELHLTNEEINLAMTLANQAAVAIDNARLFEESRRFRIGLERSEDAVFLTDIEGTIVYVNPSFENIYGFSEEEVVGKNPRIIKSGVNSKEYYKDFWSKLLNKETITDEIVNKTKEGNLVPIDGTNSPILNKNNDILGFLAIHRDITERKENEESLNRRNEYLAASAEIGRLVTSTLNLETIFDRSVNLILERFGFYYASIFILEENGSNAVLQEATGKAGQKLKERRHVLAVGSNSTVGKASATGEVVVVNNTALDVLHKHNPLLSETKAETAIPLKTEDRVIGILDIQSTEVNAFSEDDLAILQLLADQIAVGIENARSYNIAQQAVEEMREVDRLKSQFLANMSHELRTPLNSIIGFARVILKGIDGPITDLQQQDLTAIFTSGQHLLGLINDILDLSRIEAGKMDLTFDEVNINDLISSVMSTAAGLVKDKPVELKSDVEADLPLVRADAMRIRQVLINFISNAAKFTDEGEVVVKTSLEEPSTGQPPFVKVSVIDTGPGISQEDQKKLFQAFSQVDASLTRKVGGSGLGLSICHHFIQMHNGQIGVSSAAGKGSTFYFTIPIVQTQIQVEGSENGQVILAIDDDPQIIKLYERYLNPKGFQVIGLSNPAKAKERAEELKPFAITLDIMMPGYDGWQVLTDLKSSPETRDIPVVVCSIVEDEEKGFSLGAADYLVKPVLEDALLSSLDRLNSDGSIREVLVIDDDPNDLRLLGKMISEQGRYKATLAEGGQAGWNAITSKVPHAIVLDLFMPDMDGFTILENLRKDNVLRELPVIVITGADLTAEQRKQLDDMGQRLLQKSALKEKELVASIENVLRRVKAN